MEEGACSAVAGHAKELPHPLNCRQAPGHGHSLAAEVKALCKDQALRGSKVGRKGLKYERETLFLNLHAGWPEHMIEYFDEA